MYIRKKFIYYFCAIPATFILLKTVYSRYKSGMKVHLNRNFYFRRYHCSCATETDTTKIVCDIRHISKQSVGEIVNYPVMRGNDLDNKIIVIIYNENDEPIATNIAFKWKYEGYSIFHAGLYLVSKAYQKQGIQTKLGAIQFISLLIENPSYFITDLGRSASGLRGMDLFFPKTYPSVRQIQDDDFIDFSKRVAFAFYSKHAKISSGVSTASRYDYDTMTIQDSNGKEGGGLCCLVDPKLQDLKGGKKSRNNEYNQFIEERCPNVYDEMIVVAYINSFSWWGIIKKLIQ
eukprot:48937_1